MGAFLSKKTNIVDSLFLRVLTSIVVYVLEKLY